MSIGRGAHLLGQICRVLLELAELPVQLVARRRPRDADVVHHHARSHDDAAEFRADPEPLEGIALAPHQEEAAQVAAVGLQEEGLDAGDLALLLEPAGGPSYDGTSFANSGLLQEESPEFPEGTEFPETWELTFDAPGEYTYYCALHGGAEGEELMGMVGTIVVS